MKHKHLKISDATLFVYRTKAQLKTDYGHRPAYRANDNHGHSDKNGDFP